ncbi:hypothetical protein EZJ49_02180 [Bdellovibrio bacteriovorus]|uniref:hypothetical protein n=1 Tax=Bdellovibrio bacteriovorus TaxID=959 RepID=UPI0021D049FD|nr:hypothetical protein [Bdellovibrio bacteriovorus]UXR65057.1 hypothetical protein EZJ49_02180 [Bdellovibrio bacteriovorus]
MLKYVLFSFTVLMLAGCASTPTESPSQNEETFAPNWETHAGDAEVMAGKGPAPASEDPTVSSEQINEQALEAQQFATINFVSLGKDLKAGQGKYLNELFRILKISGAQQAPALRQIRSLYEGSPSPVQFSQDLWSWYKRR